MRKYIGVISDTHGLMRPEAKAALQGSELIIHAGDIGGPEIIKELKQIAPVHAIRGNIDKGQWAGEFPETEVVQFGDYLIYVLHNLNDLDLDPGAAGFRIVISGHSHQPKIHEREDVLFFNPGSAGPRRFKLPITVGHLVFTKNSVQAKIILLDSEAPR